MPVPDDYLHTEKKKTQFSQAVYKIVSFEAPNISETDAHSPKVVTIIIHFVSSGHASNTQLFWHQRYNEMNSRNSPLGQNSHK